MSWEQLKAIKEEARTMREDDKAKPLVECPHCGQRLDVNSAGVSNCPFGHYRTTRTTRDPAGP